MKVLVNDAIAESAIEMLKSKHDVTAQFHEKEELLNIIPEYDAIIVRGKTKVPREVIEKGVNLKVIGRAGIGVDNIDVQYATERKIPVVNAPMSSTVSVAELAVGHMISLARHLPYADKSMKEGKWDKKKLMGNELMGKTLGLVGCGRIGAEVVSRVKAFEMETIAFDPYLPQEVADKIGIRLTTLDDLLENSDYISIHALLTDETRGMIGREQFEKMKDSVYIVNCARGPIIDEAALVEALENGKIRGAALDVFANEPPEGSPLLGAPNVVFTPHLGASTVEGQNKAGMTTAEQVDKVLSGQQPDFAVNKEIYNP
ncbi:MAG: phosphoglycerate dehydrogenase [Methanobacteriota archaeon]|nr:MAG: phosphoglycerate dehydrogenase [Euryarchaeota archaeon]